MWLGYSLDSGLVVLVGVVGIRISFGVVCLRLIDDS